MSLEIKARLICDKCGAEVLGKTGQRSTSMKESYWDASDKAKKAGWVTLSRGRYRTNKHFCAACADKG